MCALQKETKKKEERNTTHNENNIHSTLACLKRQPKDEPVIVSGMLVTCCKIV